MAKELNRLHQEIISEFERRITNDTNIPDGVASALQEEDDSLKSSETIKKIIEQGIDNETE